MRDYEVMHFGQMGDRIDGFGRLLLHVLTKHGEFEPMDDLPCVTISAVGGSEFMVKAEVHHVPISGTFVHTFAGSRNAPDLYGVLEFKIVDEQGIPTGVPLLTVAVDAEGNCGWRGRIEDLHTFLPINLEAARFQRTAILNALRWKVQELLVERAKLPE